MSYVDGFIVAVPKKNLAAYRRMAKKAGKVWREYGALEYREWVADDVKVGKRTSFPRSVKLKPGETVVFSWITYKSRAQRDRVNARVMADKRLAGMMDTKSLPFDAKRMIYGGFAAVVEEGSGGGRYVDGIVVPVPESARDDYARLAGQNAKVFREYGATRVVETIGDDVPRGKVTDFYRAVKAADGETVAFSFIEWPDKAARDEAWQKIMQDQRMQHGGGLFDGSRMFWGGFEPVIDTMEQVNA